MKLFTLKKRITAIALVILFFSCKKENSSPNTTTDIFEFKIGTQTYQIDTLRFSKLTESGGIACFNFFEAKSRDNACTIRFTCNNRKDSISAGNYIIINTALGTSDNRNKIVDFGIIISGINDLNKAVYYQAEPDFNVTISALKDNYISGSFNGKITGGTPVPGGFGASSYTNIRTVEIKDGKFSTRFYDF